MTEKKSETISNDKPANETAHQDNTDEHLQESEGHQPDSVTETLTAFKTIIEQMRQDNHNRDKQTALMVKEVREGFASIFSQQESKREQEMSKLYQSLHSAFSSIEEHGNEREDRSLSILKALSDSIMKDHEQTLKEVQEQEKLQDKKLHNLTIVQEQRSGRNRWLAIPGMFLGITAIIYMFYVVSIMEEAMTSMSRDMHEMQFAVANMSNKMDGMSDDTHSMNTSMKQLNGNMGQMSRDMNVMTHYVSPTMKGIRTMMPWSY